KVGGTRRTKGLPIILPDYKLSLSSSLGVTMAVGLPLRRAGVGWHELGRQEQEGR
ncbi:hypothetical protein BaRGS_00004800, partial [Batillaria attramentaria]